MIDTFQRLQNVEQGGPVLRPFSWNQLIAILVVLLVAGIAPSIMAVFGIRVLPTSGALSSPLPIFILSMLANAYLIREWGRTLSDTATIEAAQLEKQHEALHDPLTGAANRRSFDLRLKQATELEQPRHALLMIDLDNFKPVNDIYGHAAGDQILCGITAGIKRLSRPNDLVCRLGGDEFAILLPDVDTITAEGIACEVLDFVRNYRIIKNGQTVQVGTSIGMVMIDRPGLDQTSILEASDVALYAAKDAGRGAVMVMEIPADFKTNKEYSTDTARRVDAGASEAVNSANSHRPTDGRNQILKGIPTVAHAVSSSERRARSRRGVPDLWITVEPETEGNAFSPGMSMRELVVNAEARADGGADLVRWTIAMVLKAVAALRHEKLATVGFTIPIPAKAVVAVPTLGNELTKALALSASPMRHITLVLLNAEKVHDNPAITEFVNLMHLSNIKVAFQIRSTSFDQLSPLTFTPFNEIHLPREIHRSIKPGTPGHTAIKALKSIATNFGVGLVATEVDNIDSLKQLSELGIERIAGPIIGPADRLGDALVKLLAKQQ